MLTLGVETSGSPGSIALLRDGNCLAQRELERIGRRHAQTLVAEVGRLFADFELDVRNCDLVAVSLGPGSFTGLRVGVTFAKTFAYASGCQLAAVETFQAIAEACPADVESMDVIADAQRSELFVARFRRVADAACESTTEVAIHNAEQWCGSRAAGDVVTGPGVSKVQIWLPTTCRVLREEFWYPRAETVGQIGEQLAERGDVADMWTLEPRYLRKSAAEDKWDAQERTKVVTK